jgi:hypothetical protein
MQVRPGAPDTTPAEASEHAQLNTELRTVREKGVHNLRSLKLPALVSVARLVLHDPTSEAPVLVEQLLRQSIERMGGGPYPEAAASLFGLARGTRGLGPRQRREAAADALDHLSAETFRTRHQNTLVSDLADQVLGLVAEHRLREARTQLERRHPAETRLAVQWVERFEAYNRLWTPIYALGADLTAYRSTLLESDRPYDRAAGTNGPDDAGYTQEMQAEGYGRFALYRYASFEWHQQQFMNRYGGLWLLSSGEAESAVSEAVYQITWHITPFNERDESWLRSAIQDTRQELDGFLQYLSRTTEGQARHQEWQDWLKTCTCTWTEPPDSELEYFPTRRHHDGIADDCQVHRVIEACAVYCDVIDRDWRKIADWYHLDDQVRRGRSSEDLYNEWNTTRVAEDISRGAAPKEWQH